MNVSVKAILVGFIVLLLTSIALSFLASHYLAQIYNSIVTTTPKISAEDLANQLSSHPLWITYLVIATVLGFGLPGYISATIANRSFMFHGFVVGLLGCCALFFLGVSTAIESTWFTVPVLVVSILTATAAGKIRELHVKNRP